MVGFVVVAFGLTVTNLDPLIPSAYECKCGHTGTLPWPPYPLDLGAEEASLDREDSSSKRKRSEDRGREGKRSKVEDRKGKGKARRSDDQNDCYDDQEISFADLPPELLVHTFGFLNDSASLAQTSLACKRWYVALEERKHMILSSHPAFQGERAIIERELLCFHSKDSFGDDILGIGVSLEHKPGGDISYISTAFDLISHSTFYSAGVRKGVWKEPFTDFLPLYINESHGRRALPLIKKHMAQISRGRPSEEKDFRPEHAVDILTKLMNSLVVNLNNGNVHASIKALEGYCAFHQMLLVFADLYPEIVRSANMTIGAFISGGDHRNKRAVPALGEFLPLLTISRFAWKDVANAYLQENFVRNVSPSLPPHN